MKGISIILFVTTVFTFFSCYKEIELEKYQTTPKIVLNCAVSTDTVVMATISRTWFYTEVNPNTVIEDAKVELYINGEFREEMLLEEQDSINMFNAFRCYVSTITPQANDIVKVQATCEYGSVWAEDQIPEPIEIEEINYTIHKDAYNHYVHLYITFRDPPNQKDFYLIQIGDSRNYATSVDFSFDPVFFYNESILDNILEDNWYGGYGGRVFSDELIDGKRYSLHLKKTIGNWYTYEYNEETETWEPKQVENIKDKVCLYKISESYYRYLYSLQNYDVGTYGKLVNIGFAEPLRIYNNIQGGIGILGTSTKSEAYVLYNNPELKE